MLLCIVTAVVVVDNGTDPDEDNDNVDLAAVNGGDDI